MEHGLPLQRSAISKKLSGIKLIGNFAVDSKRVSILHLTQEHHSVSMEIFWLENPVHFGYVYNAPQKLGAGGPESLQGQAWEKANSYAFFFIKKSS